MGALQDWKRFSLHCIGIKICGRLWIKFLAIQRELAALRKFYGAINFYILDNSRSAAQQLRRTKGEYAPGAGSRH